ncbi:Ig-like domain-containing protein [Candidatus Woesearchaeota archaeon]|nr:Ig-like domain-containing protein [Candidatus Woesearchaeota archaeon]
MKKGVVFLVFLLALPLVFAQPSVIISSPQDGQTVAPGNIPVSFSVTGYETYPSPLHLHFTLDTEAPRMYFSFDPYVLSNVGAGTHTLLVELVDATHKPLPNPQAHAFVSFTAGEQAAQVTPEQPTTGAPSSLPVGQVYEAFGNPCANGMQDAGEEGIDCGFSACGVPCYQAAQPVAQEVPVGKAGGYMETIVTFAKGSAIYLLIFLLAAGAMVGGYFGYSKLVQGHYAEVPPEVTYNSQLANYIQQCTAQGFPRKAIYDKLKGLGFSEKDLDYHFSQLSKAK